MCMFVIILILWSLWERSTRGFSPILASQPIKIVEKVLRWFFPFHCIIPSPLSECHLILTRSLKSHVILLSYLKQVCFALGSLQTVLMGLCHFLKPPILGSAPQTFLVAGISFGGTNRVVVGSFSFPVFGRSLSKGWIVALDSKLPKFHPYTLMSFGFIDSFVPVQEVTSKECINHIRLFSSQLPFP